MCEGPSERLLGAVNTLNRWVVSWPQVSMLTVAPGRSHCTADCYVIYRGNHATVTMGPTVVSWATFTEEKV